MEGALRRGGSVHIRPLAPGDQAEFLRRATASRRLHRPWSYPPASPDEFRQMFDPADAARSARLVVCRNDDGAIVGYFGLGEIVLGLSRSAYLGY